MEDSAVFTWKNRATSLANLYFSDHIESVISSDMEEFADSYNLSSYDEDEIKRAIGLEFRNLLGDELQEARSKLKSGHLVLEETFATDLLPSIDDFDIEDLAGTAFDHLKEEFELFFCAKKIINLQKNFRRGGR